MSNERENGYLLEGLQKIRRGEQHEGFGFIKKELNRNKHERYLREIQMLEAIFPTPDDIPGFDPMINPIPEDQCNSLEEKMKTKIGFALDTNSEIQRLATECAPFLRRRDGNILYEQGPVIAMKSILSGTLFEGIRDMRSLVMTFREMQAGKSIVEPGKLIKSYPVALWFGQLHGRHEPRVMEHVGSSRDEARILDKNYFSDNGNKFGINSQRVDEYLDTLESPITSKLGCVALYTSVYYGLWNSISDIYEKCDYT